jgi:hypothetical protein
MAAGRNIVFGSYGGWVMSDADPTAVYVSTATVPDLDSHASTPVHTGDTTPVVITAGGNIEDMTITVPKAATISAGGDITGLNFTGQNVQPGNVTSITALGNILYDYDIDAVGEGIELAGPGCLIVETGGRIDLGQSEGIQAVGNYPNKALDSSGSLIVAAGFSGPLAPQGVSEVSDFFRALQAAGDAYTPLLQSDQAGAQARINQARAGVIEPFLASHGANGGGDITMTYSQISTSGGGGISILATGSVNVGTTELPGSAASIKNTGIFTSTGGAVNLFAAGDVNVNESRIMTFQGGDITVWSDKGNINAGKGSETAISVSAPVWSCDSNGVCSLSFAPPPVVGSGIRALTYASGPTTPAPAAGNIYLFAPQGVVNAGEAGISGSNLVIGAMYGILNVANISFTGQAVGLPPPSQGAGLEVLTGSYTGADLSSKSNISSLTATGEARVAPAQPIEDIVLRWVDVQVIDVDWNRGVVGSPDEGGRPEEKRK